ncbi:hypothetical protein [Macrococcus psychrotolerans]|uniref:Helix-turn-helix domain-containing protein n=1 Tax=Macrococcus psychrotolerans TaxID=3039389 RepID=A0AAU6RP26_9STAP
MAYKHLNTDEHTFIESYYHQNLSVKEIAKKVKRLINPATNEIMHPLNPKARQKWTLK